MKPMELINKIFGPTKGRYPEDQANTAKAAFLANLSEALKISEKDIQFPKAFLPEDHPLRGKFQLLWYAGMIVGYGQDISEENLRSAHTSMIFVWSRAIISDVLGYEGVNYLGVPLEYGIA